MTTLTVKEMKDTLGGLGCKWFDWDNMDCYVCNSTCYACDSDGDIEYEYVDNSGCIY